jgi:hypothetical protein
MYIGNQPYQVAFVTDTFSGNGSTTAFTMSVAPANTASVLVAVSGVLQDPSTYSVSGTTLTFTAAPPSATGNISCRYLGIPASGVTTTAYRTVTEFTATAGQTTFTPPSYTVGFINVYQNGALLGSADYTATNGTTVVLTAAAALSDLVTVESFLVSSVLNAIPATAGSVGTTYLTDASVTAAKLASGAARTNFGAGAVLQVVQTLKTDTFSTTSGSFTNVTGLTVSITPTSSSSKILVLLSLSGVGSGTTGSTARIARDGTGIGVATSAGSRNAGGTAEFYNSRSDSFFTYSSIVLDSPATTSAITYSGQVIVGSGGSAYTVYVNRSPGDTDSSGYSRGASSITVMEIAG